MLSKLNKGARFVRPALASVSSRSCACAQVAKNEQSKQTQWLGMGMAAATLCGAATFQSQWSSCDPKPREAAKEVESRVISLAEMKAMNEKGRVVVAYQGTLYDMTDFTGHPGGYGRITMAAGGDLEVYWKVYTQHNRGHIVEDVMAPYKIGTLSDEDMNQVTADTFYDDSAYADDPQPFPELLTNTRYPYNAEGRLSYLTDTFQTPIGRHFVRNHSSVPVIDPEEYMLTVVMPAIEGVDKKTYTLNDLKTKFSEHDVTTVIQCNGNRREDYHYYDGETPAYGPPHWVAGAIGCATWTGPRLRDVLRDSGLDVDGLALRTKEAPAKAQQIGLLAYDQDEVGNQYCCSFPFDKAIDPFGDVILATKMNGVDIPRSHGYPVRCIVPGHAGARNCKYLQEVQVTDSPCQGHGNWKQYAVHAPDVHMRKIAEFEDYKKELILDPPVQEMPVQSLITSPSPGDIISALRNGTTTLHVKGIAWGGGGSGINRVDVSVDGGKNFTRADVHDGPWKQHRKGQWAWKFFEKDVPIPDEVRNTILAGKQADLELTSKALNASWNNQPEHPTPQINAHGCCVNHWYRVPIKMCPKAKEHAKGPEGEFGNKPSGGHFTTPFLNLQTPSEAREWHEGEASEKWIQKERFSNSPSRLYEQMKKGK